MQQKIKILDPHEAIKIAAGEVIQRPANIIKELIENSIDAGAKNISLYLQAAGKDLIKITDDGCGMSEQDSKLCFAHHATSKISSVNDLSTITTYGFRGEALSSIASVCNVELITKTESDTLATQIKFEHGKFISQTQINHPVGTTFIVSKLFENIPARKKFLKTDDTEWNLIISIIQAFGLRYPSIYFKIFHNNYLAYNCPATEQLKTRCAQLWSNNLHEQLIDLTPTTQHKITATGTISNTQYFRFNRGQIFTFVNNRWVKNQELYKAILKGYQGVLPLQKFPAAFIFIDIDPTLIDINIHPQKEEIKFLHPHKVQQIIEDVIKQALQNIISKTFQNISTVQSYPQASLPIGSNHNNTKLSFVPSIIKGKDQIETEHHEEKTWHHKEINFQNKTEKFNTQFFNPLEQTSSKPAAHKPIVQPLKNDQLYQDTAYDNIIGQFKKTYIMIEKLEQLIIIDQHAAHERILYERFKSQPTEVATVHLLFPHLVKLTMHEVNNLQSHQQLLQQHGIVFERFNDYEIIIQATPVAMSAQSIQDIIQTIATWLDQYQQLNSEDLFAQLQEKILAEKACKAACKAGDNLNIEQMQNLIKELAKTANNFCCPHGRPTQHLIKLKDIEKFFKRDYAGAKQSIFDIL